MDPKTGLTAPCPAAGPTVCRATPTAPAAPAAPGAPAAPAVPAAPPPVSPRQLAFEAYNEIRLAQPRIGSAPCTQAGCLGAVGVPVWLWTQPWTTQSATAAAGGLSVTVSATVAKVVWSMGDGGSVTCLSAGTPYEASMGWKDSPDCGYRFSRQSADQPGQAFAVSATAMWNVRWTGDFVGAQTVTTVSTVAMRIGEYQSLTVG